MRRKRSRTRGHGLLHRTLVAWVWLFATFMTWSLATPYFSSPDAPAHEFMAYTVGHGVLWPERSDAQHEGVTANAITPVPFGLLQTARSLDCLRWKPEQPADCLKPIRSGTKINDALSSAGRNLPTYYLLTGWPSLFTDGAAILWGFRIVAAALAALFGAWAFTAAMTRMRSATAVTGVALAMTPMAVYLGGLLNPNSLEIMAAMALGASSVVFAREPDSALGAIMYRRMMIAAAVMVSIRMLAPVWVAVWFVAFVLIADRRAWAEVFTRRGLTWAALPAVGAIGNVIWTLVSGMTQYQSAPKASLTFLQALRDSKRLNDELMLPQHIGVFGWLDTPLRPEWYVNYTWATLVIVAIAWVTLNRRQAWAIVWLAAATYLIPITLQAAQWNTNGGVWQGRYSLPMTALIPIMATMLAADRLRDSDKSWLASRVSLIFPIALLFPAATHIAALLTQLRRNIAGYSSPVIFDGPWQPPVPGQVLVAVQVLLLGAGFVWLARAARREVQHPSGDQPRPAPLLEGADT